MALTGLRTSPPQLVPRLAGDPAALDLLSRLLTFDPRQRITAGQALEHPWFTGRPLYGGGPTDMCY